MSIESNKLMNLADAKVLYDDLRNRQEEKLDKPSVAGTNGQVLTSDGQGGQSWQTPSGGGSGSAESFVVTIEDDSFGGYVSDKTVDEIKTAILVDKNVTARYFKDMELAGQFYDEYALVKSEIKSTETKVVFAKVQDDSYDAFEFTYTNSTQTETIERVDYTLVGDDYLREILSYKQDSPETAGTAGQVLSLDSNLDPVWATPQSGGAVDDVQINGTSILSNGVANIPKASSTELGAVRIASWTGVKIETDGSLNMRAADETYIRIGTNTNFGICPARQHFSAFYGLAKAAGDSTQASSSNPVGTYTDDAKAAIQSMLGIHNVEVVRLA